MSLFANSADIKTVTANGTDILRVHHNGVLIWQKLIGIFTGDSRLVNYNGYRGFYSTDGNTGFRGYESDEDGSTGAYSSPLITFDTLFNLTPTGVHNVQRIDQTGIDWRFEIFTDGLRLANYNPSESTHVWSNKILWDKATGWEVKTVSGADAATTPYYFEGDGFRFRFGYDTGSGLEFGAWITIT